LRGLVLSGGGPLATAWESGLLAGLARGGLTFRDAGYVLGTSAGSMVGAQVAGGAEPEVMLERVLAEERGELPAGAGGGAPAGLARLPELFFKAQSASDGDLTARAEVGAYALSAATESEAEYVARVAAGLGIREWPETGFGCVAVNARTGAAVVLDRHCGADLAMAVAASCSLPGVTPPVTIAGVPYIDGGLRSTANADLLTGCGRVLVIAFAAAGPAGERMRAGVSAQVDQLRYRGAVVQLITPDAASVESLGPIPGDVTRRPAVARAGAGQGRELSEAALQFWRG
jgi:NTE family protein